MSVGHLQQKLIFGLGILLGLLFGYLLLTDGIVLGEGLVLELCMNQILSLRNL